MIDTKIQTSRFISQTLWYTLFRNSSFFFQLLGSIFLARLLEPKDFGYIALVIAFTGIGSLFIDFGFSVAYIQRKEIQIQHTNVLFFISSLIGFAFASFFIIFKDLIISFYSIPELSPIIFGLSISLMIGSLTTAPFSILKRSSRFKELGLISILSLFFSLLISIILAFMGYGVMSMVYGAISKQIILLLLSANKVKWKPGIKFKRHHFKEMFDFGKWLTLSRIAGYINRNLDTLLIGKYFGPHILGIYTRAYKLMMAPMSQFVNVIAGTSLPIMKDYQNNDAKLWAGYSKIITAQLLVLVPVLLFVWTLRYHIIELLYGETWALVGDYLTYMLPVVLFDMGRNTLHQILIVKGKTKSHLTIALITSSIVITSIVIGVMLGDVIFLIKLYVLAKLIIWLFVSPYLLKQVGVDFIKFLSIYSKVGYQYLSLFLITILYLLFTNTLPNQEFISIVYIFVYFVFCLIILRNLITGNDYEYIFEQIRIPVFIFRILRIKNLYN